MGSVSLKYKLLFVLTSVTALMLIAYAGLAMKQFESDKMAYIFDSSTFASRAIATQIRSETDFVVDKAKFLMRGFDVGRFDFHPYSRSIFSGEGLFSGFLAYRFLDKQYVPAASLWNDPDKAEAEKRLHTVDGRLIQHALESNVALTEWPDQPGRWILALKFEIQGQERPLIVFAIVKQGHFFESFTSRQVQDNYLLGADFTPVVSPQDPSFRLELSDLKDAFRSASENMAASEGVKEVHLASGETLLVSLSQVGLGGLKVGSVVTKSAAFGGIRRLMLKSIYFLFILISLTVVIAVLGSNQLTSALKRLLDATRKVALGDFDVAVVMDSKDEVGQLAQGFNTMTSEIKRLLSETAEKTRMESELKTAQLVQSTLFPPAEFHSEQVSVKGFYAPASECGGDWWHYNRVGNRFYFWIGDATGHGVPAALVTSAARSAAEILEQFPNLSLPQVMALLNKAIFSASHGQVNMTFFVGCLDQDTHEFTYCNASHDPPYHVPSTDNLKRKDFIPLMDNNGPRLGEASDSSYESSTVTLQPGDKVVFYTDGVVELVNTQGESWGERKFLQCLVDSLNAKDDIQTAMDDLHQGMENFREGAPFKDDVTYFMVKLEKAA